MLSSAKAKPSAPKGEAVQSEIEYQAEQEAEEPAAVIARHAKKTPGAAIETTAEGPAVRLTERDADVLLRFEAAEVAAALYAAKPEDAADDAEASAEEDFGDFGDSGAVPFGATLDIKRAAAPNRILRLHLDITPGAAEDAAEDSAADAADVVTAADGKPYAVYVADVSLLDAATSQAVPGPALDTLDPAVRDALAAYARGAASRALPLLADYAVAADAQNYRAWLEDVHRVVA